MFATVSSDLIRVGALGALLFWACITDVRTRRLPNLVVLVIAVAGFVGAMVQPSPISSVAQALGGMATGFALWFVLYLFRMIGAGDVKLVAACGIWLGPLGTVEASIWSALAGGLMAMVVMMAEHGFRATAFRLSLAVHSPSALRERQPTQFTRLPYGVAIAIGVLIAVQYPRVIL